ncbi:MAG: hypothetical protein LAO05_18070 [Acidobacteriia bacterium]|nr:hypothetical protein [Terriglobia bacterium]
MDPALDMTRIAGTVTATGGDHLAADAEKETTLGMTTGSSDGVGILRFPPVSECS